MRHPGRTYAPRSDAGQHGRRIREVVVLAGLLLAGTFAARDWSEGLPVASAAFARQAELAQIDAQVARARTEVRLAAGRLERWHRIIKYAKTFRIPSDLAAAIYDAALAERIDPDLAFPLVRLESDFSETAVSPAGAIGLTQVMLATARTIEPTVTRERLMTREVNLRIGFRYLRHLIANRGGDIHLALLSYNRGPGAVEAALALDVDASNGYDRILLKDYRGTGVLD